MISLEHKYPVGIQTFSEIRRGGYIYIDKTDLVWQMTRLNYVFLSRPRRFGKSLLTTTLDSYFKGQKELFEGLKIMELETDWNEYPVLRLDLSLAKNQDTVDYLREALLFQLKSLASVYGREEDENLPGKLFQGLIKRAYEKTGK